MAKPVEMIVKVQYPLPHGGQVDGMCLVYPQGRTPMAVQQVPKHVERILLARESRKAFFTASISKESGYFTIGGQVPDKTW